MQLCFSKSKKECAYEQKNDREGKAAARRNAEAAARRWDFTTEEKEDAALAMAAALPAREVDARCAVLYGE